MSTTKTLFIDIYYGEILKTDIKKWQSITIILYLNLTKKIHKLPRLYKPFIFEYI